MSASALPSDERTEFVTTLPINSLKTLYAVVKGDTGITSRAARLAVDNVVSYGLGMFPDDAPLMMKNTMQASPQCTQEEALAAIESVMPDESGTMKAGVGKIDWASLLQKAIPFILTLLPLL